MATKWGIVSTGRICNDFVLCLKSLPNTEHEIVAVAARSHENATQFALKHGIPNALESYEALARDQLVEIVYIGNLNIDHFRVSKLMLENGKHVLCEKPLCMNLEETEELINIARKNKRFLMEGIWSRFFPVYEQLRIELFQGTIGTPTLVDVMFAIGGINIDRITKFGLGASVVLDVGVYAVQFATLVFGKERPLKVTANGILNKEGVDELAIITLEYSQERIATLTASLRNVGYNQAIVSGSKGFIRILPPFHCPTILETSTQKFEYKLPAVEGEFNFLNSQGLMYEAKAVRDCLQKGLLECPLVSLEDSRTISYIMTEVRNQLGARA